MLKKANSSSKYFILFVSVLLVLYLTLSHFTSTLEGNAEPSDEQSNKIVYIENYDDFNKLVNSNFTNKIFLLKNDIDLIDVKWTPLDTYKMSGTLDGCGFAIKNLQIENDDEFAGLFSKNGLDVKNLFIENLNIIGGEYSGGLAGINNGKIENVHITGNVLAENICGGLIAENYGDIDNCSFEGTVTGRTAAGLNAVNNCGFTSNSYTKGKVIGQKIGGLISSSYRVGTGATKISTSFSFSEMVPTVFDDTTKRVGGFLAIREADIIIENCYSSDDYPCVALGDYNGTKQLSAEKQKDKNSYKNFDFDNYWKWNSEDNKLYQKTIAISSNSIDMGGTVAVVRGNRKYYNSGETAVLSISSDDKKNIGVSTAFIGDEEIQFISGKYNLLIDKNVCVEFTAQYLLFVELNQVVQYGKLKQQKQYYALNEPIVIDVIPDENSEFNSLTAVYNGKYVTFEKIGENTYEVKLPSDIQNFTSDSVLFISADFNYTAPFNLLILLWIGIGCLMAAGITLSIIFRTKIIQTLKMSTNNIKIKIILIKSLICLLGAIALSGVLVWILLLIDVIMVLNLSIKILLLVLSPLISAASIICILYLFTTLDLMKKRGKNEKIK